jgi:hypothetical protein
VGFFGWVFYCQPCNLWINTIFVARPRTGVSAPTTVAARREDLTAGPTGGAASGNSPVEGEEEAFKMTANGPLNIVYLVM